VGGEPHVERVVRDETPTPPTPHDAELVGAYFNAHDVVPDAVPTLSIPGVTR
jgi:hypothetical protein